MVDGESNTTPSQDDAGWDYIGTLGAGTGIYLGNGWVLTADHVMPSTPLVLDSGQYPVIADSSVQFFNGDGTLVDLKLYRIEGDPGLDPLPIRKQPIERSSVLQLIATGVVAGDAITWEINGKTWQGIRWAGQSCPQTDCPLVRDKMWGSNRVSSVENRRMISHRVTESFEMAFDSSLSAVPYETQAAMHDSGGAVFSQNEQQQWELSGVIFGMVQGFDEQATFHYDKALAVDLPHYRHEIFQAMYHYGDADLNGSVDLLDLVIVGENFDSQSDAYWELGDFTGDRKVDLLDLTSLGENYGEELVLTAEYSNSNAVSTGDNPSNIPEPGTLALLAVGIGLFFSRR